MADMDHDRTTKITIWEFFRPEELQHINDFDAGCRLLARNKIADAINHVKLPTMANLFR